MSRSRTGATSLPASGKPRRPWRRGASRVGSFCAGLLAVGVVTAICAGPAAAQTPSADELALLALVNESRAQSGLRPLVWHDGLGRAAREHSTDMVVNGCFQHDSCNGENWAARIARHYPWIALGENIAIGLGNPRSLHDGWMASGPHRANMLGSFSEFGGGIVLGDTAFGLFAYATADFGDRGLLPISAIPTLPAAGVAPRLGVDATRELFVNYFHAAGGAPQAVRALVGSQCVNLPRTAGSSSNGTYGIDYGFPASGCVPVVFEAIRPDGVRVRWPKDVALVVGVGMSGLTCPETTTAVPTQDCGGASAPTPTPTLPTPTPTATPTRTPAPGATPAIPTPAATATPDSVDALGDLRLTLRPGKPGAVAGNVTLQATLRTQADFDPAAAPLSVTISPSGSLPWTTLVPERCGAWPCLTANARGTSFRGRLGNVSVSLARRADGTWKLRLTARRQTLDAPLQSGPVGVVVSVGGTTYTGVVQGRLKARGALAG